jgi:hypothetical protein
MTKHSGKNRFNNNPNNAGKRITRSATAALNSGRVDKDKPSGFERKKFKKITKKVSDKEGNIYDVEVEVEDMEVDTTTTPATTSEQASTSHLNETISSDAVAEKNTSESTNQNACIIQTQNPDPKGKEPMNTPADKNNQNEDDDFEIVNRRTPYRAAAPLDKIKGVLPREKLNFTAKHFARYNGYTGKVIQEIKKVKHMVVYFDNEQDLLKAISTPIPISETEEYKFLKIDQIKKIPSPDEVQDQRERTIQVIDIPLGIRAPLIRATFTKFGEIEKISTITKSIYQQAFITFKDKAVMDQFNNTWATFIERHGVRIIPQALTQEARDQRKNHCFKLTGFKKGTTARDLIDILTAVKAKTCFIPRTTNNYRLVNYAYVNFEDDQSQSEAAAKLYNLNGCKLYWCEADAKVCHECGHPDHIYMNCDKRKQITRRDQQVQRLYNKFRPAQHRSRPRSYAEAAGRYVQRPVQQQNLKEGIPTARSLRDPNIRQHEINDLRNNYKKLDHRLSAVMIALKNIEKMIENKSPQSPSTQPKEINKPVRKQIRIETSSSSNKRTAKEADLTSSDSDSSTQDSVLAAIVQVSKDVAEISKNISNSDKRLTALEQTKLDIQSTFGTPETIVIDEDDL